MLKPGLIKRVLPLHCLAGAMAAPAKSEEISSAYTALELDKCKDVTPDDAKDYGTVWRCEGYGGIDVRLAEGDLRSGACASNR
ncbi:MAG: hypothetical protein ABWY38_01405 [Methyloceanibacter sp.]